MLRTLFCTLAILLATCFGGVTGNSLDATSKIGNKLETPSKQKKFLWFGRRDKPKDYDKPFLSALKKAKRKNKIKHNMTNIDFVYVIANKKCIRFDDLMRSFSRYNVTPYRFTSVGKKDITPDIMFRTCLRGCRRYRNISANTLRYNGKRFVFTPRSMCKYDSGYVNRGLSLRQLARTLSHLAIIKDALDAGYENIWVMDSGTQLRSDPNILSTLISSANKEIPGWTTIYTDFGQRNADGDVEFQKLFYLRPDVSFLHPNEYLARGQVNVPYRDQQDQEDYSDETKTTREQKHLRRFISYHGIRTPNFISRFHQKSQGYEEQNACHAFERDDNNGQGDGYESGSGATGPTGISYIEKGLDSEDGQVPEFFRVGLLKGAHSYILNKKGMKLIMNWYLDHKIFIPYWQEIQIIPGMEPYMLSTPLTINQNPV